jgi:hypothetical protein
MMYVVRVGKSRERIATLLPLTKSDSELQDDTHQRVLTPAHVEEIMRIPDKAKRMEIRQKVIKGKMKRESTRRLMLGVLKDSFQM